MKKKLIFSAVLLFFVSMVMVTSVAAQTIPTRTPTPGPQTPTPLPTTVVPTSPPGGNPPPGSTSTQIPTAVTPTLVSTLYPTAEPCSDQPTILALNASFINVRTGPDTRYPVIESLVFREVRLIIGRDAVAPWWLIRLNAQQTGWVADEVVEVQGNTVNVPIVAAPLLNGATVTPGAPWQPTPPPLCATPPTATPTTTATPTASDAIVVAPLEAAASNAYPAATAEPTTQTNVLSAAVTPTATATAITLPTSIAAVPPPTLPPTPADSNVESADSDFSGLLLVGAALLLVAGTAVFLIKRR